MLRTDIFDADGDKVGEIELRQEVFGSCVRGSLLHDAVRMRNCSRRGGNADTKERGEISGGGKKPWRQKGTGRARAGTTRSPLWRGGGVVFGPVVRDFSFKMNKKSMRIALISALSLKLLNERIIVVRDIPLRAIKTRDFQKVLDVFSLRKALFVTEGRNDILEKSSRNIPGARMVPAEGVSVYDVLNCEHLVLLEPSVEVLERKVLS